MRLFMAFMMGFSPQSDLDQHSAERNVRRPAASLLYSVRSRLLGPALVRRERGVVAIAQSLQHICKGTVLALSGLAGDAGAGPKSRAYIRVRLAAKKRHKGRYECGRRGKFLQSERVYSRWL